jgi:hypothetical protein
MRHIVFDSHGRVRSVYEAVIEVQCGAQPVSVFR